MSRFVGAFVILLSYPLALAAAPVNDNFSDATLLQGSNTSTNGTHAGATFESGEPIPIPSAGGTLWWTFQPSLSSSYLIEAVHPQAWLPNPVVKAYRGDSLDTLLSFPNRFPGFPENSSRMTLRATAGDDIHLQVIDISSNSAPVTLVLRAAAFNDDFQNAISITNTITTGTTGGASFEVGEIARPSVWLKWQPDSTSGYKFTLPSPSHAFSLYEGTSLTSLVLRATTESPTLQVPNAAASFTLFADASKTYFISVVGLTHYSESFQIEISPGPVNDAFGNRSLVSHLEQPVSATTHRATREPGEPAHSVYDTPHTIWYEWTAPASGGFYIELNTPDTVPVIAVYQGAVISNLTLLLSTTDLDTAIFPPERRTSFHATAGEKYVLAFADQMERAFSFQLKKGPSNDDFETAAELPFDATIEQRTIGATLQPGELPFDGATATLWHRFTVPTNGTYVAHVTNGTAVVFRGTSLTNLVITDPTSLESTRRSFPFRAAAGETVFIAVHAQPPNLYTLRVGQGPANDDFANRTLVTSNRVTSNFGYTLEPNEPVHSTNVFGGSLWWKWIPTGSGLHRVQVFASHEESVLAIYEGLELGNLTRRASVESANRDVTFIDFFAEAGVEYSLAFNYSTWSDDPVRLEIHNAPAHDAFANALPLQLGEILTNEVIVATLEPGETWSTNGTVWYTWTAPTTGSFAFVANGAGYGVDFHVFTGTDLNNLQTVATMVDYFQPTAIAFRAIAGSIYRFAVALPVMTERTIRATILPGPENDDLVNGTQLSGSILEWSSTTLGATTEPGEGSFTANHYYASVWARWTAPSTGQFRIVCAATSSMSVSVFQGTSFASLRNISMGSSYGVTFFAEAGATYLLRIATSPPSMDRFTMRLSPVASNETAQNALTLTGTNITVIGQNWTLEDRLSSYQEPLWYEWTAPSHGFLNYSMDTNIVRSTVDIFHLKTPTLLSDIISPAIQGEHLSPHSGKIAVTAGITYRFKIRAYATSNLVFNLKLSESPVELGSFNSALFSGDAVPFLQNTNVFTSPDALQIGPLAPNKEGWFEMVFYGKGTLQYRTKASGNSSIRAFTSLAPRHSSYTTVTGPHGWTLRTLTLSRETNIVRWTVTNFDYFGQPATVWFDDLVFTPANPNANLSIIVAEGTSALKFDLHANRTTTIDTSTNLVDWRPWTNLQSPTSSVRTLTIPGVSNNTHRFFRARVGP